MAKMPTSVELYVLAQFCNRHPLLYLGLLAIAGDPDPHLAGKTTLLDSYRYTIMMLICTGIVQTLCVDGNRRFRL